MGQDISQRVVSEPVSVPWVAIRKTVYAPAYRHHLRIRLACEKRRLVQIGFIRLLNGRVVIASYPAEFSVFVSWDGRHECSREALRRFAHWVKDCRHILQDAARRLDLPT
jgi:hypothetical protein